MYDCITVIRFVVSVPVLSEQIAVALPIVSHASKCRTRLLSCIIFYTNTEPWVGRFSRFNVRQHIEYINSEKVTPSRCQISVLSLHHHLIAQLCPSSRPQIIVSKSSSALNWCAHCPTSCVAFMASSILPPAMLLPIFVCQLYASPGRHDETPVTVASYHSLSSLADPSRRQCGGQTWSWPLSCKAL